MWVDESLKLVPQGSRVYGSGEGRLVLWQQVGDGVLILGVVPIER